MARERSESLSEVAMYSVSDAASGATPVEDWVSRSHSSAPEVSELAGPTFTWFTGTCGRPCWASAVRRSLIVGARLPSAMTASVVFVPGAVEPTSYAVASCLG